MMLPLAWDDFRLVQSIAHFRSLGGAAEALSLNHSTVFRRLNSVEEQLGIRIFERARSGYLLTSAGEEMVALAQKMGEAIVDFERRIAGQDVRPSGELRVTTTDTIFSHLIAPIYCAFRARYPEITLDFVIDNRALNLSRRDADVAIRAAIDPPETLVGRKVATLNWGVFVAQRLVDEGLVDPAATAALLAPPTRWIGLGEPLHAIAGARWLAANVSPECFGVKVNNVASMGAAIEAGLGIGCLPCFMAQDKAALIRLLDFHPSSETGLWVLTHPDLKRSARVRAFLEFFGNELAKMRKTIEGEV
jgi:DNA-binding transcriptional LysR family regulator